MRHLVKVIMQCGNGDGKLSLERLLGGYFEFPQHVMHIVINTNQLVLKSYLSIMYPGTFQAKSLKIYKLPCNGNSTSLRLSSPYSPSHSCLKLDSSKESFEIYGLAALGTFLTGLFHALYLPHLQGRTQVLQPGSVKFTFKLRIMYATCAGIANQHVLKKVQTCFMKGFEKKFSQDSA